LKAQTLKNLKTKKLSGFSKSPFDSPFNWQQFTSMAKMQLKGDALRTTTCVSAQKVVPKGTVLSKKRTVPFTTSRHEISPPLTDNAKKLDVF